MPRATAGGGCETALPMLWLEPPATWPSLPAPEPRRAPCLGSAPNAPGSGNFAPHPGLLPLMLRGRRLDFFSVDGADLLRTATLRRLRIAIALLHGRIDPACLRPRGWAAFTTIA